MHCGIGYPVYCPVLDYTTYFHFLSPVDNIVLGQSLDPFQKDNGDTVFLLEDLSSGRFVHKRYCFDIWFYLSRINLGTLKYLAIVSNKYQNVCRFTVLTSFLMIPVLLPLVQEIYRIYCFGRKLTWSAVRQAEAEQQSPAVKWKGRSHKITVTFKVGRMQCQLASLMIFLHGKWHCNTEYNLIHKCLQFYPFVQHAGRKVQSSKKLD